jgi:hypothetical protein
MSFTLQYDDFFYEIDEPDLEEALTELIAAELGTDEKTARSVLSWAYEVGADTNSIAEYYERDLEDRFSEQAHEDKKLNDDPWKGTGMSLRDFI